MIAPLAGCLNTYQPQRPVRVVPAGTPGYLWGFKLPDFFNPGTEQQQLHRAEFHDPYPDPYTGPEVVGGRPRDFDRPEQKFTPKVPPPIVMVAPLYQGGTPVYSAPAQGSPPGAIQMQPGTVQPGVPTQVQPGMPIQQSTQMPVGQGPVYISQPAPSVVPIPAQPPPTTIPIPAGPPPIYQ